MKNKINLALSLSLVGILWILIGFTGIVTESQTVITDDYPMPVFEPAPLTPHGFDAIEDVEIHQPVVYLDTSFAEYSQDKFADEEDLPDDHMTEYQIAMWLLKSHESYRPTAYWDINRWSVGWGTISKKGGTIDLNTADIKTRDHYNRVYKNIRKRYPNLRRWHALVLAVTDYNVGNFGPSLERAIATGDAHKIAKQIKRYHRTALGEINEGLIKRRNAEAELLTATEAEKQRIGKRLKAEVLNHIHNNIPR